MNTASGVGMGPLDVLKLFKTHVRLWMIPTVVGAVAGIVFALVMPRYWQASQAIIVRDEARQSERDVPGQFSSTSEMKTLLETILELAKSKSVVEATLTEAGPPEGWQRGKAWPSEHAVEELRKVIQLTPPGGAEFGMTEVSYLSLRAKEKSRALKTISSLSDHLDKRFKDLRNERAQSMVDELANAATLAEADLAEASETLTAFETKVGADLTELRMLQNSPSATSDLRQRLVAVENAKQQHETRKRQGEQLLTLLREVRKDPKHLIATPNSLLSSQPALKRLKDGLVDAQLARAQLLGIRTEKHPQVISALESVGKIHGHLFQELDTAIGGLEVDLALSTDRVAAMDVQLSEGRARLSRLAELRTEYANLTALVDNRLKLAAAARENLADARATRASARATSLIQKIDAPETGVNPIGPGRTLVSAAGLFGGFAFGLGLLFLFAELPGGSPRKSQRAHSDSELAQSNGHVAFAAPYSSDREPVAVNGSTSSNGSASPSGPLDPVTAADVPFGVFQSMTLRQALQVVIDRDRDEVGVS